MVALNVIRIVDCITNGGDQPENVGKQCVFPFIYENITYHTCTRKDSDKDWCAIEVDSNGVRIYGKWGYCSPNCPGKE